MNCMHEFCPMEILLVAATKFEIQPTIELLENNPNDFSKHSISILITGVGIINSTYFLTTQLINKKYDIVLQAGIAGTFNFNLALGESVLVNKDTFGDAGMEEKGKFKTIFDAGFADKNAAPYTEGWLINTNPFLDSYPLKFVKGITVNKVSDSLAQRQQLQQHFAPDIETMEGAVLHFVCLQQKNIFLQIRTISNMVGERDKSKWIIKEAIINLNITLENIIKQL